MNIFSADDRGLLMQDFIQPVAVYTDDSKSSIEAGTSFALYHFLDAAQTASSNAVIQIQAGPRAAFLQFIACQANVTVELFNGALVLTNEVAVPPQFNRGTPARVINAGDSLTTVIDALTPTVTVRSESTVGSRPMPQDNGNDGIFIAPDTACQIISQSANTSIDWVIGVRELTDPFIP